MGTRLRIHVSLFYDNDHIPDSKNLCHMFTETFKLKIYEDIKLKCNSTRKEIEKYLTNFKKKDKYEKYDIFFFIFLTHLAKKAGPYALVTHDMAGEEKNFIQLEDIFDILKNTRCLVMKPKVFLVQADDACQTKGIDIKTAKIPQDSDRLLIFSSLPDKLEDKSKGKAVPAEDGRRSFLIDAFVNVIENPNNRKEDLLTLTTHINKEVRINVLGGKDYQPPLPLVSSTLTKLLYLY